MKKNKYIVFLFPHLKPFLPRITVAFLFVVLAKLSNVAIPLIMKRIVDNFGSDAAYYTVPIALILAYGVFRLLNSLFTELRGLIYAKVIYTAIRGVLSKIFRHLHEMSLRFHIERQTGRITRDIERGERSVMILADYAIFSIIPSLIECLFAFAILINGYHWSFFAVAFLALACYVVFTMYITEWRTKQRKLMNEYESRASAAATDSLLNFETVKYFGNEEWEVKRYDDKLGIWGKVAVRNEQSISVLNFGQQIFVTLAVVILLWKAASGVADGTLSIGDLVLVSTLMLQLYAPLHFLGIIYREIRQALADTERLVELFEKEPEIKDLSAALPVEIKAGEVRFEDVSFRYNDDRAILKHLTFTVPAGRTVAVVGASGAGKSTIARLLFRFYDVTGGRITVDGMDIRLIPQRNLREAIGIVPQDTVLFNDTLGYNISYGKTDASEDEIKRVTRLAQLSGLLELLPGGYDTVVGERGLKLSGGEKQRVAIARALLKNPKLFIFDEATSSLDSGAEKEIQKALDEISVSNTTLVIAHRLSTIVNADEIIVLEKGEIAERGTHMELLAKPGIYAKMWNLQQADTMAGL
ncbi:MAG: ABC transporter ATP-binding protein/permease [Deferribacteraceae bacterium]|jgi:ATP-binding cassette subfamily B protein|nr:ABC transporter ATP-binding protein/permease [Deferribacteraceae bacterium]